MPRKSQDERLNEKASRDEYDKLKGPFTLQGSIHPNWDNYTEEQKMQYIKADAYAARLAINTLNVIDASADIVLGKLPVIYYRQYVIESLINILQKQV